MFLEICTKFLRVLLSFTSPVSEKILDFLYCIFIGKTKSLSPIQDEILLLSAADLAESIRSRKITSEEAVMAYIKRIKEVDLVINACVDQRFQEAVDDAKLVDKTIEAKIKTEKELQEDKPLLGVPFTCKEIVGVKGMSQTLALKRYKDRKAPTDAETVALYRRAGAIPLVVTNIPTISMWWNTSNPLFGMTKNPYNNHRMVGGSSGGEAALIASAGAVIGIGTDIGGSVRIPAAFCGIYAHKPSRGIISNDRPTPTVNKKLAPFLTTGPMCRYARDLPLLVKILSGKDVCKLRLSEKVDFKKVNLFYIESFPSPFTASEDVKAAVRKAAKHFEDEYHITTTKLEIEELRSAFAIWQYKFLEADGSPLLPDITDENGEVNWIREFIKIVLHLSEYDIPIVYFAAVAKRHKDKCYYQHLETYERLKHRLEKCLQDDSVLLLPTFPEVPPHTNMSIPKVEHTGHTTIFNILGFPVTQIPAGMSKSLPIGVQAVAGLYKDHLTLATAIELEKVFGGWRSPSAILLR